jgi:hypothetical protein
MLYLVPVPAVAEDEHFNRRQGATLRIREERDVQCEAAVREIDGVEV